MGRGGEGGERRGFIWEGVEEGGGAETLERRDGDGDGETR